MNGQDSQGDLLSLWISLVRLVGAVLIIILEEEDIILGKIDFTIHIPDTDIVRCNKQH